MGVNDAQEMLEAAKEQAILDERQIAAQQRKLTTIRDLIAQNAMNLQDAEGAGYEVVETDAVLRILDQKDTP